jgi:hypothetical protein
MTAPREKVHRRRPRRSHDARGAEARVSPGRLAEFRGGVRRRLARYRRGVLRWRYSRVPFRMRRLAGTLAPGTIPVVMCLWVRPERFPDVLAELAAQLQVPRIRLLLWNNRPTHDREYAEAASRHPAGALSSVEMRSSRVNLGGLGRFFVIRHLRREGYTGPVVMLDDDQAIGPHFVRGLIDRYEPRSVAGVWAFRQHGSYWAREEIDDGAEASYVGTGGSIVDGNIVDLPGFFNRLPDRFAFIEDQWMSYLARRSGWRMTKADLDFEFVMQERNQFQSMLALKEEFFRYLYNERPDFEPS